MLKRLLGSLGLCAVFIGVMTVGNAAEEPKTTPTVKKAPTTPVNPKELAARQEQLMRQYKEFIKDLLIVAQRLEKSDRVEDKEKAKTLKRAIELAEEQAVENKFTVLVRALAQATDITVPELQKAANENDELIKILNQMISILLSDDESARIKAERERLTKMLEALKGIIREQKIQQSINEAGKGDLAKLAKDQKNLADKTKDLAKEMAGKDGKGDPKDGKGGDPKDGKGGDPKDGKGGDPKDGKGGDPKDGKGGDPKDGKGGDPKDGKGKTDPKDGKGGDPKDGKGGDPKDGKGGDPKDGKGGDPKDGKGGDPKDGKGGDPKDGKGGGDPKDGKGGDPKDSPSQPPAPGGDQVKKAVPDQKEAAEKIADNKRDDGAGKQNDAIKKLEEAQKELEKRLKQLREEELERLLANLEARCNKMLAMQIEVWNNTKGIHGAVKLNEGMKPNKENFQKSQVQADREGEIVAEAEKTIDLLKTEGSAVAFPRILEETKIDMVHVRERLTQANVGEDTQFIEESIIASLKEMIAALKKAQQDMKDQKSNPMPPMPMDPNAKQKLIDELAEIKMIRNLQVRVNDRTKMYGKRIQGGEEQADDAQIKLELRDLSQRQEKVLQMTRDIAEGRNK